MCLRVVSKTYILNAWAWTDIAKACAVAQTGIFLNQVLPWTCPTTLKATQGQIWSQCPTDATSERWHLKGSWLDAPPICPGVVSRVACPEPGLPLNQLLVYTTYVATLCTLFRVYNICSYAFIYTNIYSYILNQVFPWTSPSCIQHMWLHYVHCFVFSPYIAIHSFTQHV